MAELWEQIPKDSLAVLDSYLDHYAIELPDIVHTSKNETVGGVKTFTGNNKHTGNETFSGTTTFTGNTIVPTLGVSDSSTKAANAAYCMSGKRKTTQPAYTQLFFQSPPLGSGNINLSQPWTNFDELIIFAGNDSQDIVTSWRIETWELQRRIDIAKGNNNKKVGLFYGSIYWHFNPTTSTSTLWTGGSENCSLYAVYGVNFKFPKYA